VSRFVASVLGSPLGAPVAGAVVVGVCGLGARASPPRCMAVSGFARWFCLVAGRGNGAAAARTAV